jgi:glycine betaine/proline transport system substrate-binding protein
MRNSILGMAGAMSMLAFGTGSAQACGNVTLSEMNWASSQVVTAVAKFIMENGYGCKVKTVPSSTVPVVASLAENGSPDIATELWLNGAQALPGLIKSGKVVELNRVLSDGGVEGWYIPQYLAEKHPELKTIDGILKNPKLIGGRFHQCPSGWGCQIANANITKAFEIEKAGIEVFQHGSGETLATSIASAYADKKPWFGYYWAPTAVLGKFPMVRVDLGPADPEKHACNADKEWEKKEECKGGPFKSQFTPSPVATVVTTAFAKREPAVAEMLKKLSFTNAQMGKVLAWKKDKKASSDDAAAHFLGNYKDVWGAWLDDGAKKKLAALLK